MIFHSPHPHPHLGAWGRCWAKVSQTTVIISNPQHLPFYCFIYKQGEVNWENRVGSQSGPSKCGVVPGSVSTMKAASSVLFLPLGNGLLIPQGSLGCRS